MKTYFVETSFNKYRKATKKEISKAKELLQKIEISKRKLNQAEKKVQMLQASCTHNVFEDVNSVYWTTRVCLGCGKTIETI